MNAPTIEDLERKEGRDMKPDLWTRYALGELGRSDGPAWYVTNTNIDGWQAAGSKGPQRLQRYEQAAVVVRNREAAAAPKLIAALQLAEWTFRVPAGERDEVAALTAMREALAEAGHRS